MPKRHRRRGPHLELWPEHARPLDPETFRTAVIAAMATSVQPHPLLHERVSPHMILQDGDDEEAIWLTDTPMNRVNLTLRDHYEDQAAAHSASWRFWALGPLLARPELAPWIRTRTAEGREVEHPEAGDGTG